MKTAQMVNGWVKGCRRAAFIAGVAVALGAGSASAETYYWIGGSEGDFATASNWATNGVAATAAPGAADTVMITNAVNLKFATGTTVSNLVCTADTKLTSSSGWCALSLQRAYGAGMITLNKFGLQAVSGVSSVISNDVFITDLGSQDNWLHAYNAPLNIYGKLKGNGYLVCRGESGYYGVQLYGDNSAFTGRILIDGNGRNRFKFGTASSGSAAAAWTLAGAVPDSGTLLFDGGTIFFGSLTTDNGQIRGGQNTTLEIGALNTDCTMGAVDLWTNGKIIRKIGTGALSCAAKNYGGIEVNGGRFVLTSDNLPSSTIKFQGTGGTLVYQNTTVDVSGRYVDSTAPMAVDSSGHDLVFATALAASNIGGLTKKGAGSLSLTAMPAYTGATVIEQGALALPTGTAVGTLAISNGAALVCRANQTAWTNGAEIVVFTCTNLAANTVLGASTFSVTNVPSHTTYELDFSVATQVVARVTRKTMVACYWVGGEGGAWSVGSNWADGSVPETLDTVIFTNDTAILLDSSLEVSNFVLNADVAFTNNPANSFHLSPREVGGFGTLSLRHSGIETLANVPLTITNDVEILPGDPNDPWKVNTDSWFMGNTAAILAMKGRLLGNGKLLLYSNDWVGPHLYGDNSGFRGYVQATKNCCARFCTPESGSANAIWQFDGGDRVYADGSAMCMLYGVNFAGKVLHLGAIVGAGTGNNRGQLSLGDGLIVEVGALGIDCESSLDLWNNNKILRKVGAGRLTYDAGQFYGGLEIAGGEFCPGAVNSFPANGTHYVAFNGGTLVYKDGVLPDPSASVLNSTNAVSVDTGTNVVTWATALAASNQGGFTKKGAGRLTLAAKPAYTGATAVKQGELAFAAGAAFEALAVTPDTFVTNVTTVKTENDTTNIVANAAMLTLTNTTATAASFTASAGAVLVVDAALKVAPLVVSGAADVTDLALKLNGDILNDRCYRVLTASSITGTAALEASFKAAHADLELPVKVRKNSDGTETLTVGKSIGFSIRVQ